MNDAEILFGKVCGKVIEADPKVTHGKMMSSPGLKYKNKVFAFFFEEKMVFKLGKKFDPQAMGIANFGYLSPFKTKPPMKAWFEIPYSEKQHWDELARLALKHMKSAMG